MKLRFEPVHRLFRDASLMTEPFPGWSCWSRRGQHRVSRGFGVRQLVPRKLPVFRDTLFDVASRRRPSSPACSPCVRSGRGVSRSSCLWFSCSRSSRADRPSDSAPAAQPQLRVARHRPFWRQAAAAAFERRAISYWPRASRSKTRPARAPSIPTSVHRARWLLERVTGERLDVLAHRQIAAPLGLLHNLLEPVRAGAAGARARRPIDRGHPALPERHRVLLGEVDDPNAMAMGGIAGHAGLFSTAGELSQIAAACAAPGAETTRTAARWSSAMS